MSPKAKKVYFDIREATDAFDEALPHFSFPSDDITWGQIKKLCPNMHTASYQEDMMSGPFVDVLAAELELGQALFNGEKYGKDALCPAFSEGTVADDILIQTGDLKEAYKKVGMYQGEESFKQQVRRIEDSIVTYIRSLGK
jgi:hypothetical protein